MTRPPTSTEPGLSVVIPCHDEEGAVEATVRDVVAVLGKIPLESEIIAVNDGSTDKTGEILDRLAAEIPALRPLHNQGNRGYGYSLKRGLSEARFDRVVITDADGTYPNDRIPELVALLEQHDMVVGARTGKNVQIPLARRPAKWALLRYARWMSRADIKDVNSGMRAMWARHVHRFWNMLPDGFSFTTTITMAHHINRLSVHYLSIDYFKRIGSSGIHPIKDTTRFFMLVLRTTMYFRPLQVFGSLSLIFILGAIAVGVGSKLLFDKIHDISVIAMFMLGINFLGLGLLGDLVNSNRPR